MLSQYHEAPMLATVALRCLIALSLAMNSWAQDSMILVRHCEFDNFGNLTMSGIAAAREIGKAMKGRKINSIVSSPVTRTQQTAEEIRGVLEQKVAIKNEIKLSSVEDQAKNWVQYLRLQAYGGQGSGKVFVTHHEVISAFFEAEKINLPIDFGAAYELIVTNGKLTARALRQEK